MHGAPASRTSWAFSRRWALAMVAVTALVLGLLAWTAQWYVPLIVAGDPEARPYTDLVIVTLDVVFAIVAVVVAGAFLGLAVGGGELEALPYGLRLRMGRKTVLLPWGAVADIRAELRTMGRGGAYPVLAIFTTDRYRWPRSYFLFGSDDRCLAISSWIIPGGSARAATELAAARRRIEAVEPERRRPPLSARYAKPLSSAPRRRWRQLGCAAFAWVMAAAGIIGVASGAAFERGGLGNAAIGVVIVIVCLVVGVVVWKSDPASFDETMKR